MNTSLANSKKVNRMMGFDLHWWNGAMLWSSGLAVLAALAALVSTTAVIRLQNREFASYSNEMDKAVAVARTEAETARTESEDAHARSIEADERAAAISHQAEVQGLQLNEKVAQLEADLAKADQQAAEVQQRAEAEREELNANLRAARAEIASANQRAADATEKAEAERLERLRLEANLGPRRLGPALISHLAGVLTGLAGMKLDLIVYASLSPDAPALGSELQQALADAGMAVRRVNAIGANAMVHGILVRCAIDSSPEVFAAASKIVQAIQSAGLSVELANPFPAGERPALSYTAPPGSEDADLRVLVGAKE